MRAAPVLLCLLLALAWAAPARAASEWKSRERECISRCPARPTFGGIEDDKAWKARVKKQKAYDDCLIGCVKKEMSAWRRPMNPARDGSMTYFKRNLF